MLDIYQWCNTEISAMTPPLVLPIYVNFKPQTDGREQFIGIKFTAHQTTIRKQLLFFTRNFERLTFM